MSVKSLPHTCFYILKQKCLPVPVHWLSKWMEAPKFGVQIIYSNAGPSIQNSKIRLFKYLPNKIQTSIAPHLIFQKCSWNVLFNVTLLIHQYHSDIKLKISNYFANGIYINECNMMRSKRWQLETGGPCSTASFKTFVNHSFLACKELKCF